MQLKHVALAVCGSMAVMAGAASAAQDKLVMGITQYPSTLHPVIDSMVAKSYTLGFSQRGGVGYDKDWKLVCFGCEQVPSFENGLAEIVDRPHAKEGESDKGIKMTVHYKKDQFWGDGTPITTKDIEFWFEVVTSGDVQGNPSVEHFRQIEKLEIVDDYTVNVYIDRISYKYNAWYIPDVLPSHIEKAVFDANPKEYHLNTKYVTEPTLAGLYNGPYLIDNLKQGQFIALEKNPHWKGKAPHFTDLTLKVVEDTQALQANLLSNDVDYIPGELGITLDQAMQLQDRYGERYNIDIRPAALYEHLDVQLENQHLGDARVRQALLYSLDRKLLTDKLFNGAQPVADSSVSVLDATFATDTPHYEYHPEKAKALLKEAGYELVNGVQMKDGQPLEIVFSTTSGNKTRELVQQFAQGQWKQVGINTVIDNQTARVFFGTTMSQRKHQGLGMFAWGTGPEHLPRTTLHSKYIPTEENNWAGQNYAAYSNPQMDSLIERIDVELNLEKRKELWRELQHLYAQDLPAIPLYFRSDAYIMPKWLKGVEPTGHHTYSSNWAENWVRAE